MVCANVGVFKQLAFRSFHLGMPHFLSTKYVNCNMNIYICYLLAMDCKFG
jgi:hypothetical protein